MQTCHSALVRSAIRSLATAALAATACFASRADVTFTDGTLTVSGETNLVVTSEAALKALAGGSTVTNVIVDAATLTFDLAADETLALPYSFRNDAAIAVTPSDRKLTLDGARFFKTSLGYAFGKKGAGTLFLSNSAGGAIAKPSRFTVWEGPVQLGYADFFGNHSGTTTNLVIDVREGASWLAYPRHSAVGPVELTGATWRCDNHVPSRDFYGDTAFKGGITVHASSTPSRMYAGSWFHIGHPNTSAPHSTNCVINVEEGAELYLYAKLLYGADIAKYGYRLTKRGGGTLYLMGEGNWNGGTFIEGGKIVLGHAKALGTGSVTLSGDVEVEAIAGLTFTFPTLKGSGTITVSGAGGVTFPDKASTITATDKAADPYAAFADGVMKLNALDNALDVASGTATLTGTAESYAGIGERADIRKTGTGKLVLGSGLKGKFRRLVVEAGEVEFADDSGFGTSGIADAYGNGDEGGVQVAGGTIRPTADYKQGATRFTFTGTGNVLDVPKGVTFTSTSNCLYTAGATITKTGEGDWCLSAGYYNAISKTAGTTWIVDEGRLFTWGGGTFGGHTQCWGGTIEIHEKGLFELSDVCGHQPLGPIVLRGGTVKAQIAQFLNTANRSEGGCQWGGFAFNGGIKALNSTKTSQVIARQCYTSHSTFLPEFEVEQGAVLEMNTALRRGYATNSNYLNDGDLVKSGEGTLRLLRPLSLRGRFAVSAGTVELGEGGYIDPNATIVTCPGAKILLNDGTRFVATSALAPDIVRAADVWVDATRISASDGATLSTLANLGTAGGTFAKFPTAVSGGIIPNAPKFIAAGKGGINGLASIGFDGTMALALDTYKNTGTNCEVFAVGVWTNYYGAGSKGKWGGFVSLGSTAMTGKEDQYNWGVLSCYFSGDNNVSQVKNIAIIFGNASKDGTGDGYARSSFSYTLSPVLSHNEPFVLRMQRGDTSGNSEFWRGDKVTQSKSTTYTKRYCRIDRVALGTRLMTGGCATTYGASSAGTRNLIGQMGEVLVFSKALSATERATVNDYLRRKWIGTAAERPAGSEATLEVEAAAEAKTAVVVGTTGSDCSMLKVSKAGGGEAVIGGGSTTIPLDVAVEEGTIRLQSARLASRVPIWIDADDAATCLVNDAGEVTNLANKGFCGGSFVQAASCGKVPHYPTRTPNGLNSRATLTFDGEAALMTEAYTNKVAPRRFSIYAVGRRNQWRLHPGASNGGGYGKWATPFAFVPNGGKADESEPGVYHIDEYAVTKGYAEVGSCTSSAFDLPGLGEATLYIGHVTTNGYYASFETNETNVAKVPRTIGGGLAIEPMNVERVFLGARTVGGKVHYYGTDNTGNRCWYGDIAELIVTTEPLSYEEEIELLDYLRAKWFNKGEGSATPPEWLSGTSAAPQFGSNTALAMADGTALVSDANTLALGSLETQGTVSWTRLWSGKAADAEAFALFDAEAISLGTILLRPVPAVRHCEAKVLGYGEKAGEGAWRVFRPDGRERPYASVTDKASAYWLLDEIGTYLILR